MNTMPSFYTVYWAEWRLPVNRALFKIFRSLWKKMSPTSQLFFLNASRIWEYQNLRNIGAESATCSRINFKTRTKIIATFFIKMVSTKNFSLQYCRTFHSSWPPKWEKFIRFPISHRVLRSRTLPSLHCSSKTYQRRSNGGEKIAEKLPTRANLSSLVNCYIIFQWTAKYARVVASINSISLHPRHHTNSVQRVLPLLFFN